MQKLSTRIICDLLEPSTSTSSVLSAFIALFISATVSPAKIPQSPRAEGCYNGYFQQKSSSLQSASIQDGVKNQIFKK